MNLTVYQKIDNTLLKLAPKTRILQYLEAKNSQVEKEKFLKGDIKNPRFKYSSPRYDVKKLDITLQKLTPPDDELGKLLKAQIENLKLKNKIIKKLGNSKVVINASRKLYGKPSRKLVKISEKLVKKLSKRKNSEKNTIEANKVVSKVKKHLKELGLTNWQVISNNRHSVSVSPTTRTITISKYKKYSPEALKRLIVHEINVHVFRAENGFEQPLKMFGVELPDYLATEEGIAAFFEKKYHLASPASNIRFPLRVIAIDAVNNNLTFRECFEKLKSFGIDSDTCWETTYRAFRGGGYLKDHVYLEGYYKVKEFLKNGGNLDDLYVGKIGLKHLELCKQLSEDGIIKSPKYLPGERE